MPAQKPHVIILRPGGRSSRPTLERAEVQQQAHAQNAVGTTQHFVVYSDGTANGNASAQALLSRVEADFAAVQGWFGGLNLPPGHQGDDNTTVRTALPLHVLMDAQAGGAYHFGCDATDLYIEPQANTAAGLVVAELVEVFEAAQGKGWDCGHANGEALSRVLATERQPELGGLTQQTGQSWWADGHADYVTSNSATDQDQDANGCGPLFLYYLHSQLGFSWQQITAAAGPTLGACYQSLTGNAPATGFSDFVNRLASIATNGQLSLPANGNPFPIGSSALPPTETPAQSGSTDPGTNNLGGGGPNTGLLGLGVGAAGIIAVVVLLFITGVIHLG